MSVSRSATASRPTTVIRARTVVAPVVRNLAPPHENGSRPRSSSASPVSSPLTPSTWRPASSSAGCSPNPAVPVGGSASSANTSSPRRQAARAPRNTGP